MIRLAVNATPLLGPRTGIGNYIVELGQALAETGRVDAYSFYGVRWRHEHPGAASTDDAAPMRAPLLRRVLKAVPFKRELRAVQQRVTFRSGVRRYAIELYHEPNYVPVSFDVPVVITVHDLSWMRFPAMHPPERVRWLERNVPRALADAAAILVDSEFVRREVLEAFTVPRDRVHVAHLGVSRAFRPRSHQETAATLDTLQLAHKRYVLCVGTIEPRKNVGHVLEAYASLPAALRAQYPLVIAGASGWGSAALERRLHALADSGQIRFAGPVDATRLRHLYAGAVVFVFPSLYEGFGLPPLEAMASGVPVMASARASLPEVIGSAGIAIDPDDPAGTSAMLARLLQDERLQADLVDRGLERAGSFTWTACAAATLAAYDAALAR